MPATLGILASSAFTETQLRLPGGAVTNSVLSTPDHSSFAMTDFEAAWFGSIDDPTVTDVCLISQWSPNSDRSWSMRMIYVSGVAYLKLWISTNGTSSVGSSPDTTAPLTIAAGQYVGLRVTRQQSTGNTKFYQSTASPADPPSWTQRGSTIVVSAAGAIFNSTVPVMIGGIGTATAGVTSNHVTGYFRRAYVRNGYDGSGTIVAQPDVTALADTATSFTDSTSKVWTLNGATDLIARAKP